MKHIILVILILALFVEHVCPGTSDLWLIPHAIFGYMIFFGTMIYIGPVSIYTIILFLPIIIGWVLISYLLHIFIWTLNAERRQPVFYEDEPLYFTMLMLFIRMLFLSPGMIVNAVMTNTLTLFIG